MSVQLIYIEPRVEENPFLRSVIDHQDIVAFDNHTLFRAFRVLHMEQPKTEIGIQQGLCEIN
jgi:hypothetical protein